MKIFSTRTRVWWKRRKLRKAAKKNQTPPLREFIYLDEVTVYSLNAARLGSVAADFSETRSSSLQGEVGSSAGVGAPGTASAGLNSRLSVGQSRESQVNRTAIVQTAFKEFYELEVELDSFAMRPMPRGLKPPNTKAAEALATETKSASPNGWIVDPEGLERGRLVEVEVELDADDTFRTSMLVSTMLEIVETDPETFGDEVKSSLAEVKTAHHVLEKLLAGLVPLRGRVVGYEVVDLDGREWIVHKDLLSQLADTETLAPRPLYVVGVAEQNLFWRDLRRMLFSGAKFRVLVRMAEDGLRETWNPVKLAHVLEPVSPELTKQIKSFGPEMIAAMSDDGEEDTDAELHQQLGKRTLTAFAKRLAAYHGHELAEADLSELEHIAEENESSLSIAQERQRAFGEVASLLRGRFGWSSNPEAEADCRSEALQESGLNAFGELALPAVPNGVSVALSDFNSSRQSDLPTTADTKERYLDSEIVAIYW